MTTIEDLFDEEPEARIDLTRLRLTPLGIAVQILIFGATFAALAWGLARSFGYSIPYLLILWILLTLLTGARLVLLLRAPAGPKLASLTIGHTHQEVADRPFIDARKWADRLEWARGDIEQFRWTVLPAIKSLADERLRLRHGITRYSHPERATELLGPELSAFLDSQQLRRVPAPAELSTLVKKLEELS